MTAGISASFPEERIQLNHPLAVHSMNNSVKQALPESAVESAFLNNLADQPATSILPRFVELHGQGLALPQQHVVANCYLLCIFTSGAMVRELASGAAGVQFKRREDCLAA